MADRFHYPPSSSSPSTICCLSADRQTTDCGFTEGTDVLLLLFSKQQLKSIRVCLLRVLDPQVFQILKWKYKVCVLKITWVTWNLHWPALSPFVPHSLPCFILHSHFSWGCSHEKDGLQSYTQLQSTSHTNLVVGWACRTIHKPKQTIHWGISRWHCYLGLLWGGVSILFKRWTPRRLSSKLLHYSTLQTSSCSCTW